MVRCSWNWLQAEHKAVHNYDLYSIRYDYFELLWLQYDSLHILSYLITVEYDMILLWIQYNTVAIFNHNHNVFKMHDVDAFLVCMCHIWCHIHYSLAGTQACFRYWLAILGVKQTNYLFPNSYASIWPGIKDRCRGNTDSWSLTCYFDYLSTQIEHIIFNVTEWYLFFCK